MQPDQLVYLIQQLKAVGVSFDAGLTDEEVRQIELTFAFSFPPDLRAFLQAALPISDGFVPWRRGIQNAAVAQQIIEKRMQWPVEGIAYDALNSNFWPSQWGAQPADNWQREQVVR